jgi:hypothetical protein
MRPKPLATFAAVLLASSAAIAAPAADGGVIESVSVSGTGRVRLTPDRVSFTIGVQTAGASVTAAVQENSARVSAIIAALKKLGAGDRDIQTSQLSIYPQQDRQDGRPPRISGYQVSNTVTVTRNDPTEVGKLLQAAVDAGANSLSGVEFSVSDPARGRDAGLQGAFAEARAKAEVLARAAGRTVGRALTISEGAVVRPPMPRAGTMIMEARMAEVPVMSGSQEESYTVSVVFELR